MAVVDELARLLVQASVIPYRRVGKVRVVYDPFTPPETVQAAINAVKKFATANPSLVDAWGEPTGHQVHKWRTEGFVVVDVCDDPCPRDVDPATCAIGWLIERCTRYHFRVLPAPDGNLAFEGIGTWDMKGVSPLLPAWFLSACRDRKPEIVAHLGPYQSVETLDTSGDPEPDCEPPASREADSMTCHLCGKDASDPESRARLADPAYCDRGGASSVRNRNGVVTQKAEPRCPFKPAN